MEATSQDETATRVLRLRLREIAARAGISHATAHRSLIPKMLAAGVLMKHGRCFYGRTADIDSWLMGRWPA